MGKKCKNCGAELSEEASFCPYCATVQTKKQTAKPPRRWRKRAVFGLMAVLCLAAAVSVVLLTHRPETFEGGAEVIYTEGGDVYHVLVSFSAADGVVKNGQPEVSSELADGMESAFPSQLYVYKEETDEEVWEEFLQKVESCSVETVPQDGAAAMTASEPVHNESFPYAALASDITYAANCKTNEIVWTMQMKNGDTIRLRHKIHVTKQEAVSYFPEETPMDTAEELQALLTAIEQEVETETVVCLYLPPVTYDREISFGNHTYRVYGGSGGTGINAYSCALLSNCTLTGWDVGAAAQNGAWVGAVDCIFEENGVGLKFDTMHSSGSAPSYPGNRFARNGVGIAINHLPGHEVLNFSGCTFSQNGCDIENEAGHPIDTSGADFE